VLESVVRSNDWIMSVLVTVRAAGLPQAWAGAGVLRDLVWSETFGTGFRPGDVRDVDVAFFDPADLSRAGDERATARLTALDPHVPWEATNQAAVHTWYPAFFGTGPVPPLSSVADGVATWPETATAVAVRLTPDDKLDICAPLGLDDLLNGVWRHNPRRCSRANSRARLARHRPAERWPRVTVIPPA
jgi:hypothetical protein